MPLPADWRERWIALVRGLPADASFLAGGPILDASGGLAVYQEAWVVRHVDALRVEAPAVAAWLGDRFDEVARSFFADTPSRSFTLDRVADRLSAWLAARGEPRELVELAELDHRVMRAFSAAELPPVEVGHLGGGIPELLVQPHVALLRHHTDAHRWRTALVLGQPLPPIGPDAAWIAVWRQGLTVQTMPLEPAAWTILAAMAEGRSLVEALGRALSEGHLAPVTLDGQLAATFQLATQYGLLAVRT